MNNPLPQTAKNPADPPPLPKRTKAAEIEQIRSTRFRREREAGWRKLESLVTRAEKAGMRNLSYEEALELSSLYRSAVNGLSVARAISMDRALLEYLDRLCARAYLLVYAPQESIRGAVGRLFRSGIPQAFRRSLPALLIGFVAMILGGLVAGLLYRQDPAWFYTFVPGGLADGRTPEASVEYLRSTLYGDPSDESQEGLAAFASYLFSNNTQVAIFTFALGVFAAFPSFALTFYNGLILGAFSMLFIEAGLGVDVFGWLSIHGVTEISAICVACAGGAKLGTAVLLPGDMPRSDALREAGRDAVKLMILAALMLVVAALVEGFLRQLVQSTAMRLFIGWGLGALWLAWLLLAGRGEDAV